MTEEKKNKKPFNPQIIFWILLGIFVYTIISGNTVFIDIPVYIILELANLITDTFSS